MLHSMHDQACQRVADTGAPGWRARSEEKDHLGRGGIKCERIADKQEGRQDEGLQGESRTTDPKDGSDEHTNRT